MKLQPTPGPVLVPACLASILLWIATSLSQRGSKTTTTVYDPTAVPWGLFSKFVVLVFVITLLALVVRYLASLVSTRSGRWLFVLLLATAAVRFIGIDHEIEERYYRDEGTYYRHASEINQGEMLRPRFVYPHLTYYLYAFSLFVSALFPGIRDALAAGFYGVTEPMAVEWLIMRALVALLATATAVPVFHLARDMYRRLHRADPETGFNRDGSLAGVLAAGALLSSTLFNEIQHLMISDGPSASFAIFCVWFASRAWALEAESRDPRGRRRILRMYLLAGVFAALAAAAKYPAGIVAVAIATVWLDHRRPRADLGRQANLSIDLIWAGAASMFTFILVMPSLLAFTRHAFTGGQGIFFGVRQYGGGGWIGVMPDSNTAYYSRLLSSNLGVLLCLTSVVGLALLVWRRLGPGNQHRFSQTVSALLHPVTGFALAYFALIAAMNMVVRRNLVPAIPAFCVLAAVLAAGALKPLMRQAPESIVSRNLLAAAGALALLAQPLYQVAVQTVSLSRPGTRVQAKNWIRDNLPHGTYLVSESYTPRLPRSEYIVQQTRFAPRPGLEALQAEWVDYILVSSAAYARFFDEQAATRPHHLEYRKTYQTLFEQHEMVRAFAPSAIRQGPRLELYRGGPLDPVFKTEATLHARDAFIPDGGMREKQGDTVHYEREGQWSSLGVHLAAGSYQLQLDSPPAAGDPSLELITPTNRALALVPIEQGQARFELHENLKVLLRLRLPQGSHYSQIQVRPALENPADR